MTATRVRWAIALTVVVVALVAFWAYNVDVNLTPFDTPKPV